MVKRIFKIIAIVLSVFVVVVGGGFGIAALRGAFNEEVINITKLYFGDDDTNTNILTDPPLLSDYTTKINFEPANATNKTLVLEINDVVGVLDNPPATVTAGEEFTLKIKKDDKGNNIGGVVNIDAIAVDENGNKQIARVHMTLVVDAEIPDSSIYFSGNNSGKMTLGGKAFTIPISKTSQNIYLRSNLVNAFYLQGKENQNLKTAEISYTYYRKSGGVFETKTFSNLEIDSESFIRNPDGSKSYYYSVPITAEIPGTIVISAKMHRTNQIQEEFEANFSNIVNVMNSSNVEMRETMRISYNDFINKYIDFFDKTAESYAFFKSKMNTSNFVSLNSATDIERSLDFVFVKCEASINVSSIKLKSFTATETPKNFTVFENTNYAISSGRFSNLVNDFGLDIETSIDSSESGEVDNEKDYMFDSLNISPYLYISAENSFLERVESNGQNRIKWTEKSDTRTYEFLPVYRFDGNTPITTASTGEEIIGYLLKLTSSDDFFSITKHEDNGKYWTFNFNVPLPNDDTQVNNLYKALYVGFDVTGLKADDDTDSQMITIQAFTRIFIDYVDYEFATPDMSNLTFEDVDSNMTVNTDLSNPGDLTSGLYRQDIELDTIENVTNIDSVSYKSVMYFAETQSNKADDAGAYKKIATVGQYKFKNFSNSNRQDVESVYQTYGDSELVGERIFTYNTTSDSKKYYLRALNASADPVKIFAVVYLSDKNGNPIDINGNIIQTTVLNESGQRQETSDTVSELVIIRITDLAHMPEIKINSYVENMNFYTQNLVTQTFGDNGEITFEAGSYLKRNTVNSYSDLEGNPVSADVLAQIQDFLRLKILKDNYFTLYVTPFELTDGGEIKTDDAMTTLDITMNNFAGIPQTMAYSIDTNGNKQIGFNNILDDFEHYNLLIGGEGVVSIAAKTEKVNTSDTEWVEGDDAKLIKYVLHASKDVNITAPNTLIYLDPTASDIPFSPLLSVTEISNEQQVVNFTSYKTTVLEIENVELSSEYKKQNKLYAKYSNTNETNDELEFKIKESASMSKNYQLQVDENGDLTYSVTTNILADDIDLSLVDCSQAGTRTDIPATVEEGDKYYDTIEAYVDFYTQAINNRTVSYTKSGSSMSFNQGFNFSNYNKATSQYTNYIYFGSHAFEINKDDSTVNINGYVLKLIKEDNKYTLPIEKGEYFPIVDNNYALIYDELFQIFYDSTSSTYRIYDTYDSNSQGTQISVSRSATILPVGQNPLTPTTYNPELYIDDVTPSNSNSALKIHEGQDSKYATVNFTQGEEIGGFYLDNENGTYYKDSQGEFKKIEDTESFDGSKYSFGVIYEEDPNGDYIYNVDTHKYTKDNITETTHYSKKGVTVYLLITFNLGRLESGLSEATFYKALQYQLVQEEIVVKGYNDVSTNEENSVMKTYNVNAGGEVSIGLGVGSTVGARIDIQADNEDYFFNHVSFSVPQLGEANQISKDLDGKRVSFNLPNLADEGKPFNLIMSYKFKGQSESFTFFITAVANVKFKAKEGSGISTDATNNYKIQLSGGAKMSIFGTGTGDNTALINRYFDLNTGKSQDDSDNITGVTLSASDSDQKFVTIDADKNEISFKDIYAKYDGEIIQTTTVSLDISLSLKEGGNPVAVTKKLVVEISPKYIVDLTQLSEDNKIYNGQNIFANLVRLFDGSKNVSDLKNTNDVLPNNDKLYDDIFEISLADGQNEGISKDNVTISGGSIKLNKTPTTDTKLKLKISYSYADGVVVDTSFSITIRGISMQYSPTGKIVENKADDLATINNNIEIKVTERPKDFDINKYLLLTLANSDGQNAITAVLVGDDGKVVTSSQVEVGKTYTIGYARMTGGSGPELVEKTQYTFTLKTSE